MATKKYLSLEKLTAYDKKIKNLITEKDTEALNKAKEYADGLADNYESAGSVASAKAELQKKIDAVQTNVDTVSEANVKTQGEVDALETLVGVLPDESGASSVVDYINKKTANVASDDTVSAIEARVTQAEKDIDAIEADYLKEADKTELSDAITAEAATARAAEKANADAIKVISDDYLKSSHKAALEESIAAAKKAGDDAQADIDAFMAAAEIGDSAIDTLKEIQDYITSDGAAAAEMTAKISKNAEDISKLDDKVGELPVDGVEATDVVGYVQEVISKEQARAEGIEGGLDTRIKAVEAKFGDGEGNVEAQIAKAKAEAIETAATDATEKDTALETKITAAYKKYADDEDAKIEESVTALTAVVDTKAAAKDLAALDGRVTTAEGEIDVLQEEMDAVEAAAEKNKGDIATLTTVVGTKATQADFDALSAKVTTNAEAIAEFVEISEEEINALFATV